MVKRFILFAFTLAVSACTEWSAVGGAKTEVATVSGNEYKVVYVTSAPGVYDMRAVKFRWSEGIAAENRAFTEEATGQVARKLCGGTASMLSIDRIDNMALYEARWRCGGSARQP